MAADVKKKVVEVDVKAQKIGELKEQIAVLTQKMKELEVGTEEYNDTVNQLVDAEEKLTTVMKVGKSQLDAQEGSYNALVNKMAALKKVQKAVTDDASRQRLATDINDINDQLKAYDKANGVYVRNVGNYKSALEDFDGVVVNFGDNMREAMDRIEPTKQKFESVQKIATGVASGFAALQGVTALLGIENENLEKTLVKVQAAMAIAQGIGGLKDLYEGIARWGVAFGETTKAAEQMTNVMETVNTVSEAAAAASEAAAAASEIASAAATAETTATAAATAATTAATAATTAETAAITTETAAIAASTTASLADTTAKGAQATASEAAAGAASAAASASTASATASTASAAASAADAKAKGIQAAASDTAAAAAAAAASASNISATASTASAAASAADATAKGTQAAASEAAATAATAASTASSTSATASTASAAASIADASAKSTQAAASEAAATASSSVAAASTASATASAADAVAKGVQTVATEGATVAQKGLNTAMKANPIGLVIVAITALVGMFAWLKDDIVELLGGTEKLNAAWDKFKVVFSGVGNVVKQIVLGPIKTLITSVRTLVETISNLAQGDFKGAWNAIKDGFTDVVDGIKDTYDVIGNYQEAAAEKAQEIDDKRRREEAEKREKELNDYIKDMEAKSDKDWKYSEEGKKAYKELYKKRAEMYDKDSEEYKQNQRDIWMYNNEYQSRINKKEEENHKKRQDALKKALEKEKEIKEKALQEYQNLVTSYTMTDEEKLREQERARLKALKDAKDNGLFSSLEQFEEQRQKLLDKMGQEEQKFFFDKQLKEFDIYFKKMDNMLKSAQTNFKLNVEIIGGEGVFDYVDTAIKEFEKVGGNIDILSEDIKNALEGIVITPDLEAKMLHILTTYDTQIEGTADKVKKLQYRVEQFTKEYGADSELTVQATQELFNIMFRLTDLQMEKFKEISDVRVKVLEETIEDEQKAMERRQLLLQQEYLEYETSNNHLWEFGNNYLSQMYKRWNAEDEIHKARIASMQEMRDAYIAASMDMQLTEEERVKAKAEQAKLEAEIERENLDYILTVNQRKAESNDNYVNAIQDSLGGIGQILGSVADAWETSIQAEVKAGNISEEEGERQMEEMKGIQSAIALINSFSSAVSAYQSMASIPYVGPVLGAAAAAAALASGLAQVKAINAVKKGDKSGGENTRYAEVTPTAPEYNPTTVTNVTGQQETENLANAMTKSPIWVSVQDINSTQSRVKTREKESSF